MLYQIILRIKGQTCSIQNIWVNVDYLIFFWKRCFPLISEHVRLKTFFGTGTIALGTKGSHMINALL
jgi:hypothetical protein